jgi:UrcA family protein
LTSALVDLLHRSTSFPFSASQDSHLHRGKSIDSDLLSQRKQSYAGVGDLRYSLLLPLHIFHQARDCRRFPVKDGEKDHFIVRVENPIQSTPKEMTMNSTTILSRFRNVIATALFGAVASSFAILPAAADTFDAPQATVKYGDLNISNPHGTAALYTRIKAAANNVCSTLDGPGLNAKVQRNGCVNKAILDAVTKVNNSALTALCNKKMGIEAPTRLVSDSK